MRMALLAGVLVTSFTILPFEGIAGETTKVEMSDVDRE